MNVKLRPIGARDAAWLNSWLAPVAADVDYEVDAEAPGAWLLERLGAEHGLRARIIAIGEHGAGVIVWREHAPKRGTAIVELVATPPEDARLGAGMAAAAAVESVFREELVRVVYAPAPAVHGIAMYFWIRLGYRPLQRAEWPCERAGVAWLRREI